MSSESNDHVTTAGQPPPAATAAKQPKPPKLSEEVVLKNQRDIKDTLLDWSSDDIESQLPTDVLLITANDHEFNACYSHMKEVRMSYDKKPGYVYFGRFVYDNNRYVKVALMKCSQGQSNAQTTVRNGTTTLRPKVILFVGHCATIRPEKAKLGDVVISRKLETYDEKRFEADDTIEYHNTKTDVSKKMAQLILHAAQGWTPPLEDPSSLKVEVHRAAVMLSGPELVDNLQRREQLARDFPEALGLEMEGKGLYEAAYDLQMEWAVIKAVSNLADGTLEDTKPWQLFASVMAISIVYNIFHPVVLKKWPHYEETKGAKATPNTIRVSNCRIACNSYWPRQNLDDKIRKFEKANTKVLVGTIGTGKSSAALHYIDTSNSKFSITCLIDVPSGEGSIVKLLTDLAEKLDVSYSELFQTIKRRAQNEDIIFMLDDAVGTELSHEWFGKLIKIRTSVYIIVTTNDDPQPSVFGNAPEIIPVEKFDEALEFLQACQEIRLEDTQDGLTELCGQMGWNILGLTAARDCMVKNKLTARVYLKRLAASETAANESPLYRSILFCLSQVDRDKFSAVATTTLISSTMIPEFLLINQLSSSNPSENAACLDAVHAQLKSLVYITKENGIRFFSYHPFTRTVIQNMIDESKRAELLYKLAGTFMRHITKDNRFSKGDFRQRTILEHAEKFLKQWKDDNKGLEKDDLAQTALARLSEWVGFIYTQQKPPLPDKSDDYFEDSRNLLHKLCGITEEDLKPANRRGVKLKYFSKKRLPANSSEKQRGEMYGITDEDFAIARQLYTKLSDKSLKLSTDMIKELVFLRTVNKHDIAMFPEEVRQNQSVKEKIELAEPLSPSDVELFEKNRVAYSIDKYRELFLPELYLSVIYSFGRNYFYREATTPKKASSYIDLLKLAYCLSHEISERMNENEAVLHEYLVEAYGLLYLLVNKEKISKDGTQKKEAVDHARDLKNAIDRYQQLIDEERRFFEMGILKKTKGDTYNKLKCYEQILKCYKNLLPLKDGEDRKQCIKDGIQHCDDLLDLLNTYAPHNVDPTEGQLVQYLKYMNSIADFYCSNDLKEYYPRAIQNFTTSIEEAKKHNLTLTYLEALVSLADFQSKIGEHLISTRHLEQIDKEGLLETQRQNPGIQERIGKIRRRNVMMALKHASKMNLPTAIDWTRCDWPLVVTVLLPCLLIFAYFFL